MRSAPKMRNARSLAILALSVEVVLMLSNSNCCVCKQDGTAEAKAEIATKYVEYDRAVSVNDAGLLLQFYSNVATDNYTVEIKGSPKRTRKQIQEALSARMRKGNKALDIITLKGHRTSITQFRLGEGVAVVKTEEKTVAIKQQLTRIPGTGMPLPRKVME